MIAQLRELAQPGQTVLALLVRDFSGAAVIEELQHLHGAHVLYAELPPAALDLVRRSLHDDAA